MSLVIRARDVALRLVEALHQRFFARSGDASGGLQRLQNLGGLLADLLVELGDLLLQRADARMGRQQRGGKLSDLCAERALPLAQPLDQLRVQHFFGCIERAALLKQLRDELRPRFSLRARCARTRELGVDVAKLLASRDRRRAVPVPL